MIPYKLNPLGISVNENLPLTFTAETAGSTVYLKKTTGSPTVSGLHYRLGKSGTWLAYTIGNTITLTNVGDCVQFWNSADALSTGSSHYVQFVMTGSISASGTIKSMLNFSSVCKFGSFYRLFRDCTSLLNVPDINYFSVVEALAFADCFRSCSNMTGNLILNNTVLDGENCYLSSFYGTALNSAELRQTQLSTGCFAYMFYGCSALNSVEVAFTEWLSGATTSWMAAVSGSGAFTKPTALADTRGTSNIPTGWTVVNK